MNQILLYDEIREAHPQLGVEIIQRLGAEAGTRRALVCDGRVGPKTRGAQYLNPDALRVPGAHELPLVCLTELLAGAAEVAPGPGESASNRGPWVNKYCRSSARARIDVDRGAWCAFFASWALDAWGLQASPRFRFQKVGGARRLVRDELSRKVLLSEVQPGDLVAWESKTRRAPYGHVGIVVLRTESLIWTIEGNVDLRPGLDGVSARCFGLDLVRADGARPLYAGRLTQQPISGARGDAAAPET